jgi:transcriptional regulator with XRE-family HTH domain
VPSREQEVGAAVRLLRRERGLTQRQLAEKAQVSKSTVTLLEAGRGNARLESLLKIAHALDAEVVLRSAPTFVLRSEKPNPPPTE